MIETQQQVQQAIYNSGIVGSAVSDTINENISLPQVQRQTAQDQSAAVPVATVQPISSDDIAPPQQNTNDADSTDYSNFFEMISSTLDSVNTNIENLSSVILDAFDTLFPTKEASSRTANNPFDRLQTIKEQSEQSGGGLGLLGSIAAGLGGIGLLGGLVGGGEKTPPPNTPETPPTNMAGSPPGSSETPVDTSTNIPPTTSSETPSTTNSNATTTEKLGGAAAAYGAGKALEKIPMSNVQSPAYAQKVGDAIGNTIKKVPGSGIASKGLGFIGKAASKVAPFLLPLEAYTRIDNGESPYRVGASMIGGLALGSIGGLAGTFVAGPVGSVAGGIGGYVGGEKLVENWFDNSDIGKKLNQESAGVLENNNSEVNNITLPPTSSEAPPSGNNPQSSNTPPVSYVPSLDYSISPNLDYAYP